ncbi:2-hydroxychromene-2-carboxylate isomerase [Pseudolabrys sp. FHR47]|uniref:2-hydroxychromene-2-carboxylate isomerase n=1 Tax=Pseudolabrys sp. FHR47 TaxID=2562284 RepID=UPI0010BF4AEE|nr:2-hydroxychromene-2-carboxylate isomerase [Pseudolabrys sp. FHR47]
MTQQPSLDFWFEFASTYSYPAAARIGRLAQARGVALRWRPFLLGPVFKQNGWTTSPFNLYPAKGRYMWRDLDRICGALGLPFSEPPQFPQNTILPARVALIAFDEGWGEAFTNAVYRAQFGDRKNIGEQETVASIVRDLGKSPDDVIARAQSDATKLRLREQTDEAISLGIFGAPSFITADGELFWGNDRLEDALDWALSRTPR